MFVDDKDQTITRKYSDYFQPPSAFKLAEAFPDERLLAQRRIRQLIERNKIYDQRIYAVMNDEHRNSDEKYLIVTCLKTWEGTDHLVQEQKILEKYLAITKKQSHPEAVHETLNVELAKQRPIGDLFNPEKPRETQASISCCCPFHDERTPSFVIYRKSNRFKCFGCGVSGDAIAFEMKIHNIDFKQAVRRLT